MEKEKVLRTPPRWVRRAESKAYVPQVYRMLVVLDPSRAAHKRDLQREDVAWATLDIPQELADILLTLDGARGYIFLEWSEDARDDRPPPGHRRVRMNTSLGRLPP